MIITVLSIVIIVVTIMLVVSLKFLTNAVKKTKDSIITSDISEETILFELKMLMERSKSMLLDPTKFDVQTEYVTKRNLEIFERISIALEHLYKITPKMP